MMMSGLLYDEFCKFIQGHSGASDGDPLSEYLFEWLEHGNAVVESGGDFGFYMQGVIYIIAQWLEDPSILDFKGSGGEEASVRRADGLLHSGDFYHNYAFDRDWFNSVIFRRLLNAESA